MPERGWPVDPLPDQVVADKGARRLKARRVGLSYVCLTEWGGRDHAETDLREYSSIEKRDVAFVRFVADKLRKRFRIVETRETAEDVRCFAIDDEHIATTSLVSDGDFEYRVVLVHARGDDLEETTSESMGYGDALNLVAATERRLEKDGYERRRPLVLDSLLTAALDESPAPEAARFRRSETLASSARYASITAERDLHIEHASIVIEGDLHVAGNLALHDASLHVLGSARVGRVFDCIVEDMPRRDSMIDGDVLIEGTLSCAALHSECFLEADRIDAQLVVAPGDDHTLTCAHIRARLVLADDADRIDCANMGRTRTATLEGAGLDIDKTLRAMRRGRPFSA